MNTELRQMDLRGALELLKEMPGQLIETDVEVDPMAELAGVYRHVGAGGTVMRPTKEGPAMIFHNIKGHPGASVAIGVLADKNGWRHCLAQPPGSLESCCTAAWSIRFCPFCVMERFRARRWFTGRRMLILISIS